MTGIDPGESAARVVHARHLGAARSPAALRQIVPAEEGSLVSGVTTVGDETDRWIPVFGTVPAGLCGEEYLRCADVPLCRPR